jgi:hypothetical protein
MLRKCGPLKIIRRIESEDGKLFSVMDEGRKKLIYVVAGMFLVRPLAGLDRRPSPARENAFRDAIDNADELMRRLDARFPISGKA